MPSIRFYAPTGVDSVTLTEGPTLYVKSGYITADSKFALELLKAGFTPATEDANPIVSVLLNKTVDQVITKGSVSTKLTWDAVSSSMGDATGVWSADAPSRLVVPAGFSSAKIIGQVRLNDAFANQLYTNHIYKKGSLAYDGVGLPGDSVPVDGSLVLTVTSPWLPVVEGDYFELGIINTNATTDNNVLGTVRTWVSIELMR